jgi:hypothetical protein
MMTLQQFKDTLRDNKPPQQIDPLLTAMWYDAKGNWDMAHNIAQDNHTNNGSWVHAYLHRKEGDQGNAGYWYARANKPFPGQTLEAEWADLVERFLRDLRKLKITTKKGTALNDTILPLRAK